MTYDKVTHVSDAIKIVREWMADIDHKAAGFVRRIETEDSAPVSCKGCRSSGCCYQLVNAHLAEVLPIARRIRNDGLDTPELRAKLAEDAKLAEQETDRAGYMDLRRPCAMLSPRGRCNVYRERPVACRSYFVWSDRELCGPPSGGHVLAMDNADFFRATSEFAIEFAKLELGLQYGEDRIYGGPLPRVILNVLIAWDSEDFIATLNDQPWPTLEQYNRINGAEETKPRGEVYKTYEAATKHGPDQS